jgi:hypothetical protein
VIIEDHFEHIDSSFDVNIRDLYVLECLEQYAREVLYFVMLSYLILDTPIEIVVLHCADFDHKPNDLCQLRSYQIVLELIKEILDTLLSFLLSLLFIFVHGLCYPDNLNLPTF